MVNEEKQTKQTNNSYFKLKIMNLILKKYKNLN